MNDLIEHYGTGQFKLKSYVYFGQTDQGVFFEAGNDSFVLKGKGLYPIVSKFMQVMDNGALVNDFIKQVPEKLQIVLLTLFTSLHHKKMLHPVYDNEVNMPVNREHTLSNELKHYAEDNLGVQKSREGINKWQNTHVALVGHGIALKSACKALLDSNVGHIDVFWHEPIASSFSSKAEIQRLAQLAKQTGTFIDLKNESVAQEDIANSDLLLVVSDNCDTNLFNQLQEWADNTTKNCFLASVFDGEALCLPLLNGRIIGLEDALFWTQLRKTEADHSPTSLSILGCLAVQNALCHTLDINVDSLSHSFNRVSAHLEVTTHPLLAAITKKSSQHKVAAFTYPSQFQLPEDRILADYEIYKMQLAPWFDEKFGCLAIGNDETVKQMPLFQFPIRISLPNSKSTDVYGWGIDLSQAGISALNYALQSLLSIAYDTHPLTVSFDKATWKEKARVQAILASDTFTNNYRWTWLKEADLKDARCQMLLRLLSYQSEHQFKIQLLSLIDADVYVAQVYLQDNLIVSAPGSSVADAVCEALGQCCSHFQLQDSTQSDYWQNKNQSFAPKNDHTACENIAALQAQKGSNLSLQVDYHKVNPFGFPDTVVCGFATIAEESIS